MKINVLILGVGGQGIITTASIIARAAMRKGYNVVSAETHGMAQRGGSVVVHLRIGDVHSPLIPEGDADLVLALEPVEVLRYTRFFSEKTLVLLNTRKIIPPSVTLGLARYPEIEEILSEIGKICKVIPINASEVAEKAGSILATNVAIIGFALALCNLPITLEDVELAVKEVMGDRAEINIKALRMGYEKAKSILHAVV